MCNIHTKFCRNRPVPLEDGVRSRTQERTHTRRCYHSLPLPPKRYNAKNPESPNFRDENR